MFVAELLLTTTLVFEARWFKAQNFKARVSVLLYRVKIPKKRKHLNSCVPYFHTDLQASSFT